MDFAVCPDRGPSRLFRFGKLDDPMVVARLDAKRNLLHIDREGFDLLSRFDQDRVQKTRAETVRLKPHMDGGLTIEDPVPEEFARGQRHAAE